MNNLIHNFYTLNTIFKKYFFVLGSVENVIVTHIVNPAKFYVQLVKNSKAIENMNKKFSQYAKHAGEPTEIEISKCNII